MIDSPFLNSYIESPTVGKSTVIYKAEADMNKVHVPTYIWSEKYDNYVHLDLIDRIAYYAGWPLDFEEDFITCPNGLRYKPRFNEKCPRCGWKPERNEDDSRSD